jgi:hypothetical protein
MRRTPITNQPLAIERAPDKPVHASQKAPIKRSPLSFVLPSIGSIVFSALLLGVILLGQNAIPGSDDAAALSLRLGNDMLLRGGLVPTNTLTSVGYGQPLVAWEWLSDLIFAGSWRLFGLNGLLGLVGLIVALTALLLLRAVRRRGTPLLLALPISAAALAITSVAWQASPRIFSLLLALWWCEQLWAYWQSSSERRLWLLPFALALWANLDGGYVAGLILLGTAAVLVWVFPGAASTRQVDARRWQLTRALIACLLAALLTPWGVAGLLANSTFFTSGTAAGQAGNTISPDMYQLSGQLFLILLLLLGACGVLRGWLAGGRAAHPAELGAREGERRLAQLANREPGALGWAFAGVFTVLAFFSPYFLALWGLIVAPILGRELTSWAAEWASADMNTRLTRLCHALFRRSGRLEALESRRWRSGLLSALAGVFVIVLLVNSGAFPGARTPLLNAHFSSAALPVEAVQAIQHGNIPGNALPGGAGFTVLEWSHYLEWTLPNHPVMIDARTDLFDESTLHDYQRLLNGESGWNQIITTYGIRWLLIPTTAPLAQVIVLAQGWLCQEIDTQHLALLCVPAPSAPIT